MTGKLDMGVLGVGESGLMHAEIIRRSATAELCALGSSDAHRGRSAASAARIDVDVLAYDEFLSRREIAAVVISSRTVDHPPHVAAALDAGKHVLVEKPASLTVEGHTLIESAHRRHPELVLQVGYMQRFDPMFRALRGHIEAGDLGRPLTLELIARELSPPTPSENPSANGGLIVDIGVHAFDAACWLLADTPQACFAVGSALMYPDLAAIGDLDTALITIRFRSGALVHVHLSRASVVGHEIACVAHGSECDLQMGPSCGHQEPAALTSSVRHRFPADYRERFAEAFTAEVETFTNACRGQDIDFPSIEDDRRAIAIAHAAQHSLDTRRFEPIQAVNSFEPAAESAR